MVPQLLFYDELEWYGTLAMCIRFINLLHLFAFSGCCTTFKKINLIVVKELAMLLFKSYNLKTINGFVPFFVIKKMAKTRQKTVFSGLF